MKRIIIGFISSLLVLGAMAQDQDAGQIAMKDSIPLELKKKIFVYNASKLYNDPIVNRMALYQLLAENPQNLALRDSLALVYYSNQNYASAALVSQDVTRANAQDMFATEIAAASFERLGVQDKSLNYYESLYLDNSENINALYKIAFLHYQLGNHEQSQNSIDLLKSHVLAPEASILFPNSQNSQNQQMAMTLAARRLEGMIAEVKGNTEEARSIFNEILKERPDLDIIKRQLEQLDQ